MSVKNYDDQITLLAKIRIYEKLMEEGKISSYGAGAKRLNMLYKQMAEYLKWLKLPYRQKKESFSPALEEWEWV